jgi:hypothetical protein
MFKIIAGIAVAGALTGCAIGAEPQAFGVVRSIEPHYETVSFFPPDANCTVYPHYQQELSSSGALVGAAAGYVLSGGLLVPTLAVGGAGAVAFGNIENYSNVVCENDYLPPVEQEVISHFVVTYEYKGYEGRGTTLTQYQVGDSIPLSHAQTYKSELTEFFTDAPYINPVLEK